jgi:two-component system OmpR family sensor kinase/two-component system sensor histidine kinase BaeS
MNRLWLRLTLAFVAVTLIAVASVALLAGSGIGQEFRQYAAGQAAAQDPLVATLGAYYAEHDGWEGVAAVLPGGAGRGQGRGGPAIVVADAGGRIVYDSAGARLGHSLSAAEQTTAAAITPDGRLAGYLIIEAGGPLGQGAQRFLDNLYTTLLAAALIAGALGALLGFVVSRTLTAPLAEVAEAARAFAARRWDRRVRVRGATEIAAVGQAFNLMADSLEQAETLRRSLVADIAHELSTPLTVIQGNLRALLDGVYPLEQQEISTLYDETRLLARLVDDLRELALADAGQLPLNLAAVDAAELLRAAAERFAIAAESQDVTIVTGGAGALPAVRADADRVAQVLRNLLANALRHTPPGVRIRLEAEPIGGEPPDGVRVSVVDTGSGIPPEDLPHVFERFYRGDKSRARSSGGAGLGLAIARAWIRAMGGDIGVTSTPGQGSCFWFTLPRA